MIIKCEYCGTLYESNDTDKCPNCQASSGKNSAMQKQYEQRNKAIETYTQSQIEKAKLATEREKLALEREKYNTEQQRMQTEIMKDKIKQDKENAREANRARIGCAIPFVVGGVLVVIMFVIMMYSVAIGRNILKETFPQTNVFDDIDQLIETANSSITPEEIPQSVGLNETATLSKYSVTCLYAKEVNPYPWNTQAGTKVYDIQLSIENLSDEPIYFSEKIVCIADGYQCDSVLKPKDVEKMLGQPTIEKELKSKGSVVFRIPDDAKEVFLKVGDYITIKLW